MTMYEYLDCKIKECYFKAFYSKMWLNDTSMATFFYNAMIGFKSRMLNTSLEDLQAII